MGLSSNLKTLPSAMPPLLLLPPLLGLPQTDMLRKLLTEYPSANLAGIAVGNEAVSRGDVSEQQLLQYIAQVRVAAAPA